MCSDPRQAVSPLPHSSLAGISAGRPADTTRVQHAASLRCGAPHQSRTPCCAGVPQQFAIAGWRPHSFCILHTEDGMRVELQDFSW